MKSVYEYNRYPTYEEIVELERRGREIRSEYLHGLVKSFYKKVGSFFKKAAHVNVHGNHHNNARV